MNKSITTLSLLAALLMGCGKKGDSLADKAGESIGRQVTDFTKGVGRGIDQQMTVEVSLRPEVQALGLTNTIAKSLGLDLSKKGISVYFIASQTVSTTLVVRALNTDGLEIGRAKKQVTMQRDDASYVTFEFESDMDSAMVRRYAIGL